MKGFTLKTKADIFRFNYNVEIASKIGIKTFEDMEVFIKYYNIKDEIELTEKLYQEYKLVKGE